MFYRDRGCSLWLKLPWPWTSSFVSLSEPWVYITSTPASVPVFRCHNKLSWVKWARNADWWPRVPMFSKREGILVSKLSAETHGPAAGQENKLPSVPAAGLYHVHPCSSSCFLAQQQAFVGEMGQKRRLVAASSYVFEKGRNFCKQVGR